MRRKKHKKINNYIVISLLLILIVVFFVSVQLSVDKYNNLKKMINSPIDSIEIMDNKIRLKENKKSYEANIDCKEITDINEQIVYYRLKDEFKDSEVSVSTILLSGKEVITDNTKDLSQINVNLSIKSKDYDNYEQIYNIKAICNKNN